MYAKGEHIYLAFAPIGTPNGGPSVFSSNSALDDKIAQNYRDQGWEVIEARILTGRKS